MQLRHLTLHSKIADHPVIFRLYLVLFDDCIGQCAFCTSAVRYRSSLTSASALLYFFPAHMLDFDFKDLHGLARLRNFLIDKLLAGIVFHGKLFEPL